MSNKKSIIDRIIELSSEFGKFLIDHPGIANKIPPNAEIIFVDESDPELTRYELDIAKKAKKENRSIIKVRIRGLLPETSRLLKPEVEFAEK